MYTDTLSIFVYTTEVHKRAINMEIIGRKKGPLIDNSDPHLYQCSFVF